INVDNIDKDLAQLLWTGAKDSSLWKSVLKAKNVSIQQMSWAEYGFTYAHVFSENSKHFFKGGITLNILQG
ncbi:DUF5723 family protein, partial [Vibrio parahaemolyticus]